VGWSITSNGESPGLSCLSVAPFLEWLISIVRKSGSYFLARANAGERLSIRVLGLKAQDRTDELIHFLKEVGANASGCLSRRVICSRSPRKLQLELKAQGRLDELKDLLSCGPHVCKLLMLLAGA
jgi:hypothetical protein